MEIKTDIQYISLVLGGNVNAFGFLVDRYKDKVYNLALKICGNKEDAEEVAQDSFLKAYRSIGSFRMKSSFSTWLYRITYNTAISSVRIRRNRTISINDFPVNSVELITGNISEEEADREYRNVLLNYALQKISEEDRGLICLYYLEELSHDEISEITGLNKTNIKVKIHRAKEKMHNEIQKVENKGIGELNRKIHVKTA